MIYSLVLCLLYEESKKFKLGPLYFLLVFASSLNVFGHVILSNVFAPQELGLGLVLVYIILLYKQEDVSLYKDIFFILIISVIHPYWGLYIFALISLINLYFYNLSNTFLKRFLIFFTSYFSVSYYLNNGISFIDTFKLARLQYHEKVSPTHFDFFNLEGGRCYNTFNTGLSEIYPTIVFTVIAIIYLKKLNKIKSFDLVIIVQTIFSLTSLISLFLSNSIINDLFVAFDIWRIQTLWFAIGLLAILNIKVSEKQNYEIFFLILAFYFSHWPCIDFSIVNLNPTMSDYFFMFMFRLIAIIMIIKPRKIRLLNLSIALFFVVIVNLFLYFPFLNSILFYFIYIVIHNNENRKYANKLLPISIFLFVISLMPLSTLKNEYNLNFSQEKIEYQRNDSLFKDIRKNFDFDKPVLIDPSNDVIRYFGEIPSYFSISTRPYSYEAGLTYLKRREELKDFDQLDQNSFKNIMQTNNLHYLILTNPLLSFEDYSFDNLLVLELYNGEFLIKYKN
jgi:hypothetical protein